MHTFYAVKGGLIGDSARVYLGRSGMKIFDFQGNPLYMQKNQPFPSLNFFLKVYNRIDITRLMGIPIEVMHLTEKYSYGDTIVSISGLFMSLPSNKQFAFDTAAVLKFPTVTIKAGKKTNSSGVPFAVVEGGSVPLDIQELELESKSILKTYSGAVININGGILQIQDSPQNPGSGILKGKVAVSATSFNTKGAIGFVNDSLWIALTAGQNIKERMSIPVLVASESDLAGVPNGFLVCDKSGRSLHYRLHSFSNCVADSSQSYLKQEYMRLKTHLHTNIQNINPSYSDLNLDIGDVVVTPDSVLDIKGTSQISINLEQWQLVSSDWSLSSYGPGLALNSGILKTNLVDVPFTNIYIDPTSLNADNWGYNINNITLGGVITLNISGSVNLCYDQGFGHWKLDVSPSPQSGGVCASISSTGLPGMKQGDYINITTLFVLSDGETGFVTSTNPFTLYNVATFTPVKIVVGGSKGVEIPGTMDLHVPLVNAQTTSIYYSKDQNANVVFSFSPIQASFNAKGVTVSLPGDSAHNQSLDEKGFTAAGNIFENGKFSFKMHLYRTVDSTSAWVDPNQSLNIAADGSSNLTAIQGNMSVAGSDWNNFWFEGDLTGTKGASGRLKFTVYGDIIADGQQISVQNVPTMFGNIKLAYNFDKHCLFGSVDFSEGINLAGSASVSGGGEVLIDNGGWYFLAGANLNLMGFGGQAAVIFGNYPMTDHMKSLFGQYSWIYKNEGNFPNAFPSTQVNGFFAEGEIQMPIIPDIDIDFFIVHGEVSVTVGGDLTMGMNFNQNSTSYSMGVSIFGQAYAGIGVSILVGCAGLEASATVIIGFGGTISSDGSWSVNGDASIKLCGNAYCGWGLCDSECDGKFCDKHEIGGCIGVGITGHFDSGGNNSISLK